MAKEKSDLLNLKNSSKFVKIGDAAKILGVSIDTLRRWEKSGKIATVRTPGGTRLYEIKKLNKISEKKLKHSHSHPTTPLVAATVPTEAAFIASPEMGQNSPLNHVNQLPANENTSTQFASEAPSVQNV